MTMKAPFVKTCPECQAPVADWELDESGDLVVHLANLHWARLTDLSLGKPARLFLDDHWNAESRQWASSMKGADGGKLQKGKDEEAY